MRPPRSEGPVIPDGTRDPASASDFDGLLGSLETDHLLLLFIPQFGESEPYAERKKIVIEAAKKANRANEIAFMEGPMMTMGTYNAEEFVKHVETAKESGARYFLTSIPRNEKFIDSIISFAKNVIPSFK